MKIIYQFHDLTYLGNFALWRDLGLGRRGSWARSGRTARSGESRSCLRASEFCGKCQPYLNFRLDFGFKVHNMSDQD